MLHGLLKMMAFVNNLWSRGVKWYRQRMVAVGWRLWLSSKCKTRTCLQSYWFPCIYRLFGTTFLKLFMLFCCLVLRKRVLAVNANGWFSAHENAGACLTFRKHGTTTVNTELHKLGAMAWKSAAFCFYRAPETGLHVCSMNLWNMSSQHWHKPVIRRRPISVT